jgi:hypothetical protein
MLRVLSKHDQLVRIVDSEQGTPTLVPGPAAKNVPSAFGLVSAGGWSFLGDPASDILALPIETYVRRK